MANLKDLRTRIASVTSTKKITSAMKMVAASKLRQAQNRAEASRAYADKMSMLMARLVTAMGERNRKIPMLDGTGSHKKQLYIVVSGERGLCGGFNGNLLRDLRRRINAELFDGKDVKIMCVGRKGYELLKRDFNDHIIAHYPLEATVQLSRQVMGRLTRQFNRGMYDDVHIVYNQFVNAMVQTPTDSQLIPYRIPESLLETFRRQEETLADQGEMQGMYTFEPDKESLLNDLIPRQISTRIYQVLLETAAGEQAARMTAMDNATRNAGDMIGDLTLQYNRERQAVITNEITEIVSGAEAL